MKDTTMLRVRSDIRTRDAGWSTSASASAWAWAATDTAPATPPRTEPRPIAATAQPQSAPSPVTDARPNAAIAAAGPHSAPSPATARDSIHRLTVADRLQPNQTHPKPSHRTRASTHLTLADRLQPNQTQPGPSHRPRASTHPSIADRLNPARITLGPSRRTRTESHLTLADSLKLNRMRSGPHPPAPGESHLTIAVAWIGNTGEMRAGRLVSMLLLLQQRGGMTAEGLAKELGVSVRTVYRDAEALAAAGIPIYGESGHAGGYRLLDGYRTKLTGLTEGEAEALALSGVPEAAADLGLQTELAALELKLSAAMPKAQRERAEEAKRLFHLDVVGWFRRAEPVPFLALVANAAWERRRLQVKYSRWAEPKVVERELCPLGLVLKGGQWYLVAMVESGPARMYKVTNLLAAKKTDATFTRPADFDLASWWSNQLDDFDARRYQGKALVRFSPEAVKKAADNLDADSVAAINEGTMDDHGWTVASIPIETHAHAAGELLRLGGVEVLEPESLRTLMRELALEAAALHARP